MTRSATYTGRMKWDCVEEAVLTLGELGLWKEATAWTARYRAADTVEAASARSAALDGYRQWRTGTRIEGLLPAPHASPDVIRYWALEFRLASGARPEELLPDVERELPNASETKPLVASLRAELLDRLGRKDEAVVAAREALDGARAESGRNLIVRAHFDLVAVRCGRIATKAGRSTGSLSGSGTAGSR